MANDSFANWEKLLDPNQLKRSLIQTSLYLAAYETFKGSILDKLRSFYTHESYRDNKTGEIRYVVSGSYKEKVLSLYPKNEFHACCLWFVNNGAIDQNDLDEIAMIKRHRNSIAHELPKFIGSINHSVSLPNLQSLVKLVRKIDLWWLKEIEISINPDFDMERYDHIIWEEVISSNSMVLELILSIFDGDDSYLHNLHTQFIEAEKRKTELI